MSKILGCFGCLVFLVSVLFLIVVIGDFFEEGGIDSPSVMLAFAVFFLGTAIGGAYLAKRKLFPGRRFIREPEASPEQIILELALHNNGRLTIAEIAAKTSLSVAQAKVEVESLCRQGVAEVSIGEQGDVYYIFAGLGPDE